MLLLAAIAAATLLGDPNASPAPAATPVEQMSEVAFTRLSVPDGSGPDIEAGVWAPAGDTTALPLVVMSHGTGGDFRGHEDTARALAQAGFVVASLTHTGDNWRDQSQATNVAQRPRQLHVLINYMTGQWDGHARINPARIGAFGFSAGGFTVLTAAGGEPDLGRFMDHCRANPGFFDCGLIAAHPIAARLELGRHSDWTHDPRIKAVVAAAPALGFTFTREGLSGVTQPIQLWQAETDHILPSPHYVEPARDALPRPPEYHLVAHADHFDFLPPCSPQLAAAAPAICAATPGFDRAAFHEVFNREVVRFFRDTL